MDIFQAIILGVVEGFTEFLPVSSTGHLVVASDALGYYDASKMFTVVIQMGAIAAVVWFYRSQLLKLAKGVLAGDSKSRAFFLVWTIATVPAAVFGLMFDAAIEAYAVTLTVALALIIGGLLILVIEKYKKIPKSSGEHLDKISIKQAVKIGLFQVMALIPGVSRSGATIMGGLLTGLDRVTATAFSFYLGIPIVLLAGIYKLVTDDITTVEGGWSAILAGTVASFVTAFLVIKWLLNYVSRNDFRIFAYYRIIFGCLLIVFVALGLLSQA